MKILLYLLFISLSFPLFAQDQAKIDSLETEVNEAKHDTLKVQALKALAWQYYHSDAKVTHQYVDKFVNLSKRIKYVRGIWDGYNIFGILHYTNANYDSAIYWFNTALRLSSSPRYLKERLYSLNYMGHSFLLLTQFEKSDCCFNKLLQAATEAGDNTGMAKGHKALGINHYTAGEYLPALEHHLKADSLLGDQITIDRGEILQNIGLTYHVLNNLKAEQQYFNRALEVYKALNDDYGVNAIMVSLGSAEIEGKHYHKALDYLLKSLPYFEGINDPILLGENLSLLGRVHYLLREYEEAINYFKRTTEVLKGIEGTVSLNHAYKGLGDTYTALNKYEEALNAYDIALDGAVKIGGIQSIMQVLEAQAVLYYKMGDHKKAYELQAEQLVLSDSLNVIKSSKVIHEIEAKYQNEKAQHQIELLKAQNQLREQEKLSQRKIFIVAILSVVLLVGILYFLLRTRQKAHKKLKELDTLKSRFFANISHEFRTPLTLISGPVENKLHDEQLDEKDRAELEMINRNSKRLLSLVDQLLDLSKIESGGYQLKVENGDLSRLLLSLTASFEYAAKQKRINYHVAVSPATTETWFDKDAVQKITVNLLSNAIKYTPEKGIISFSAEIKGGKLFIICENSGPGIPLKDQQKIFDRFYQQNGEAGGAGIGLALVKELADLLKGKVTVSSEPDQFTTFKIILPVIKDAFPKSSIWTESSALAPLPVAPIFGNGMEASGSEDAIDGEKPLLLIVEDNKDIVLFITNILQQEYHILEADNGKTGLEVAIKHIPDIIISDVMMPLMNGIELSKILKSDERTSHIPIILLTAKAGDENKLLGFETGADDYITKPFNSEVLKVRLEKLIAVRKLLQERFSQEVILKPKTVTLTSADQKFLDKVQVLLDVKLMDTSFNAEVFAKDIGMSRMQLHRKLKGLTGLSANHFIRMYRIRLAADLLSTAGVNKSEICYMVGFNNPSYFSKCFKEFYHCTPSEFVENLKNSPPLEEI